MKMKVMENGVLEATLRTWNNKTDFGDVFQMQL